jgi:hypothetical protein
MTERNNGGRAFPNPYIEADPLEQGMTLRDWFAGQALVSGLVKGSGHSEWQLRKWFGGRSGLLCEEIAAKAAYEYADAMLKERQTP